MHRFLYYTSPRVVQRYGSRYWAFSSHLTQIQRQLIDFQRNGLKLKIRHFVVSATAAAVGTATATATANITTPTRLDVHHTAPPTQWMDWFRKDWTDELLAQLGSTPFERWYRAVTRFLSLTALATPFLLLYPFAAYSNTLQQYHWQYALWGLEQAGPTFVKLVQWATTRHDLFSPEFCSYFGTLRDTTKGHSWAETIQQLPPNFLQHVALEPTPIGSGCIAQVYKGHLLHSHSEQYPVGTPLAIKVQHPGILYKVCVDFYIMAKVAQWLEALPYLNLQYLSLVDTVTQFRDIMLPQLDLTLEAQHLQRFQHNFHSNPRVSFPTPLMDYTTKHVLTETFVHGTPILEFTNETKYSEKVRQQVALLGLETTLKMIFLDDFLHGDLHPGNILVSWNEETQQPHLHLLDCGIVLEMGPEQHVNVVKILGAFTRQDGNKAGQLMVDTSSTRHQASDVDVQLFVQGIQHIVESDKGNNFVENVGDYIVDICYLACMHKVKLEPSFVSAALAVEIMEGIASALYPDLKVIPVALPLVLKAEVMHRLPKFHLW